MSGCGESPTPSSPESGESGNLTDRELSLAESIVRQELSEERLKDATIDSGSVTVSKGTVAQSNTGHACDSGRVLRIRLIGDFPHIAVSVPQSLDSTPAAEDVTASGVLLTADHQTGQVCLVGVQTGDIEPADGATILVVR